MTDNMVRYYLPLRRKLALSFGDDVQQLYTTAWRKKKRIARVLVWKIMLSSLCWRCMPLYHVSREECACRGLDPDELVARGLLFKDEVPGFYQFALRPWKARQAESAVQALYKHARQNRVKFRNARRLRMAAI
jgi:hypothetical protein